MLLYLWVKLYETNIHFRPRNFVFKIGLNGFRILVFEENLFLRPPIRDVPHFRVGSRSFKRARLKFSKVIDTGTTKIIIDFAVETLIEQSILIPLNFFRKPLFINLQKEYISICVTNAKLIHPCFQFRTMDDDVGCIINCELIVQIQTRVFLPQVYKTCGTIGYSASCYEKNTGALWLFGGWRSSLLTFCAFFFIPTSKENQEPIFLFDTRSGTIQIVSICASISFKIKNTTELYITRVNIMRRRVDRCGTIQTLLMRKHQSGYDIYKGSS